MGYLLHILIALFTLGVTDSGIVVGERRPLLVALLTLVPFALVHVGRATGRSGRFRLSGAIAVLLQRSAPLSFLVAVLFLGWTRTVEERFGLDPSLLAWPGLGLLVALAPYVLYELCTIAVRARLTTSSAQARADAVSFERRMFASACLPFVLYVAFAGALGSFERVRVSLEEISLLNSLFTVFSLAGLVVFLPTILRRTWATAPLAPGGLRTMLELVAAQARFPFGELFVWRTGHRMANAAIVGVLPGTRYVLFSDALLSELSPREIAAVFGHEIGHARLRHAPFFVLTLACVFFGTHLALRALPGADPVLETAVLLGVFVLWALGFGFLSRRFELEADLYSLRLLGDPGPLSTALAHVTGAHAHERSSWRYFSTAKRIDFLQRAAVDERVGERLQAKLRRAKRLFLALCALGLAFELFFLFRSLPEERTFVALRLGDYAAARSLVPATDAELERLVLRTDGLSDEQATPTELEARALRAARAGDLAAAQDFVDLVHLRGREGLGTVRDALARLADGEVLSTELRARLPDSWRPVLDELSAQAADSREERPSASRPTSAER